MLVVVLTYIPFEVQSEGGRVVRCSAARAPRPTPSDLCFYICALWKKHPDSCDVFMMSYSWFYSHFVTSILIFLPKLKNSSHLELRGKAPPECV